MEASSAKQLQNSVPDPGYDTKLRLNSARRAAEQPHDAAVKRSKASRMATPRTANWLKTNRYRYSIATASAHTLPRYSDTSLAPDSA